MIRVQIGSDHRLTPGASQASAGRDLPMEPYSPFRRAVAHAKSIRLPTAGGTEQSVTQRVWIKTSSYAEQRRSTRTTEVVAERACLSTTTPFCSDNKCHELCGERDQKQANSVTAIAHLLHRGNIHARRIVLGRRFTRYINPADDTRTQMLADHTIFPLS